MSRLCQNRVRSERLLPSSRWIVDAASVPSRAWSSAGRRDDASVTASVNRAAALPVGAASATRSEPPDRSCSSASSRATVVVFPVPGPPATMLNLRCAATTAASRCRSGSAEGNSRASAACSRAASYVDGGSIIASSTWSATTHSCRQ